jgi:hypothetical protein
MWKRDEFSKKLQKTIRNIRLRNYVASWYDKISEDFLQILRPHTLGFQLYLLSFMPHSAFKFI